MMNLNAFIPSAGEAPEPVTPSPRLSNASHQFEASMMQQLLKPMQENSGMSDKDDDEDDSADSNSSLREFGAEVMARALSERGGLGISKMVLSKLAPIEASQEQRKPTGLGKS